jgi:hypothetical protein
MKYTYIKRLNMYLSIKWKRTSVSRLYYGPINALLTLHTVSVDAAYSLC